MATSNKVRQMALYILPIDAINEVFPFLLIAYTTIISHLRSQAVTDSLNDFNDTDVEDLVVNNTYVNVMSTSSAVMWVCRGPSHYYKNLYIAALVLMIIFNIVSVLSYFCRPEFWCKKKFTQRLREVIGGASFIVGLNSLIFSFDLSPWACQLGPSSIDYIIPDELADLGYDQNIVRFIRAAPIISVVCLGVWGYTIWISYFLDQLSENQKGQENDNPGNSNESQRRDDKMLCRCIHVFKNKDYDEDSVETPKADDTTYYEINYVDLKQ